MIYDFSLLFILLFFSAFFSSSETAFFSLSKVKIDSLNGKETLLNRLIKKMKDDSNKLLITILIGNNIANIGAAALATSIAFKIFENNIVSIATGVMTIITLIFGEIFPKVFASKNNMLVAKITIVPIYWFSILFFPLIFILKHLSKYLKAINQAPSFTEKELISMINLGEKEGEIKREEKNIINNILEFDDTNAYSIMTPRTDMYVIDIKKGLNLNAISRTGYSRFPIINESIDNVIGIVHIKDIFKEMLTIEDKKNIDLKNIMRAPIFIPESKKLDSLLTHFRKSENHMVLLVDEHGGISGLVTLEDLLEELVGEISDETDKTEPYIVKVNDNEWIVPGKTEIDEVNEKTGLKIKPASEYDTFSGYILNKTGRIPALNEKIKIKDNFIVTIRKRKKNRLDTILLTKTGD